MRKKIIEILDEINKIFGETYFIVSDKMKLLDGITGEVLANGPASTLSFLKGLLEGAGLESKRNLKGGR